MIITPLGYITRFDKFKCTGSLGDEKSGELLPKMDARIAESLVRNWQNIKSQAFGADHRLERLQDVSKSD